jgi:hypothetical protein
MVEFVFLENYLVDRRVNISCGGGTGVIQVLGDRHGFRVRLLELGRKSLWEHLPSCGVGYLILLARKLNVDDSRCSE